MIGKRRTYLAGVIVAVAFAVAALVITGCSNANTGTPKTGPTALGSLAVAKSALTTTAPDAKLLIVQTAEAATPGADPVWAFLFGSPKTDTLYLVYVAKDVSMGAQQYGSAGLSAAEWKLVPTTDAWKIDSDVAYTKALAASGASGTPAAYMMGFLTYKPKTDTSTVQPFVWNVQFDPGNSGATTKTIDVDARTGATSVEK